MEPSRRAFLQRALLGAGALGLRSLATGLPVSFLLDPRSADAQSLDPAAFNNPQYLILNTSEAGDPLNCNAPGTYALGGIDHPSDGRMAPVSLQLPNGSYQAAEPWTMLGDVGRAPNLFDRTAFIHHATGTEQHLHQPDVHGLMGQVLAKDMAISAFAARLAPVLGTVQSEPVVLGAKGSAEAISFSGRVQPMLNPRALGTVLGHPNSMLGQLQALRDQDLNRLRALLKADGTPGQRRFLDAHATSQEQARKLSVDLLQELSNISDNGAAGQIQAAVLLVRMKVAPVLTIHIPFGGDNHFDGDLSQEADETVSGMSHLATLMDTLGGAGLLDQVTVGSFNVFGRTLKLQGPGRSHNRHHHMTLLMGRNVRGGVIGGLEAIDDDFGATAFSSTTGQSSGGGDITRDNSLASVGKTVGVSLGIPADEVDRIVVDPSSGETRGKVIGAALA